FTLVFFMIFLISERINERKRGEKTLTQVDQFRLHPQDDISRQAVGIRSGNTLCLVRDYNTLSHVNKTLELTHTGKRDLVVMTIRLLKGPDSGYEGIDEQELFTDYEQKLFSRVVSLAEKSGKHVELMVVPSSNIFQATALTAAQLDSSEIVVGRSSVISPAEQAKLLGHAWEQLPNKPKHTVC